MNDEYDLSFRADGGDDINISRKTLANVIKLSRALVSLIPSMDGADIDSMTSTRLKEILESEAARRGVEFPNLHHQTYAKYFGIETKK